MSACTVRSSSALRTLSALLLLSSLLPALIFARTPPDQAKSANPCLPQIREGWVRLPPGKMPMMAGFGRIVNSCAMPVTITGASSPAFAEVELHETKLIDGVSRMRHVPELRIAPDASAVLKPGGLHLMLMRPGATLSPGSRVAVSFRLADGRTMIGEFEVRKPVP